MGTEIKMPQLGETVVEGTITKWLKQEGDKVQADEYIVEISTDKVDSEVPSSAAGVIQKILVQEGETVQVGTAIAVVGEDGEAGGQPQAEQEQAEPQAAEGRAGEAEAEADQEQPAAEKGAREEHEPAPREQPAARHEEEPARQKDEEEPTAEGTTESTVSDREKKEMREAKKEPWVEEQTPRPKEDAGPAGDRDDSSKRGIISPLVRRLAEENSVNLEDVSGTGTGGRIRKQDVLRFVEEKKGRPAPAAQAAPAATAAAQPAREETAEVQRDAAPATERE
ncbi:MAG: E3 binding domain-containing protein [Actinomycetota bacterium]|nr:E3 binding domain-containing protein [Actinomycetota bacterium]